LTYSYLFSYIFRLVAGFDFLCSGKFWSLGHGSLLEYLLELKY